MFWRVSEPNAYLSQWYPSAFKDTSGETWSCAEQYMMYHKAMFFQDATTATAILSATCADPRYYKRMGRAVKDFDMSKWLLVCDRIVLEGNLYKFAQSRGLLRALLSTGDKLIIEASPLDRLWGIGYDTSNAMCHASKWGENKLGCILMKVRVALQSDVVFNDYNIKQKYVGFGD